MFTRSTGYWPTATYVCAVRILLSIMTWLWHDQTLAYCEQIMSGFSFSSRGFAAILAVFPLPSGGRIPRRLSSRCGGQAIRGSGSLDEISRCVGRPCWVLGSCEHNSRTRIWGFNEVWHFCSLDSDGFKPSRSVYGTCSSHALLWLGCDRSERRSRLRSQADHDLNLCLNFRNSTYSALLQIGKRQASQSGALQHGCANLEHDVDCSCSHSWLSRLSHRI